MVAGRSEHGPRITEDGQPAAIAARQVPHVEQRTTRADWRIFAALALLAVYALPLLDPPAAVPPAPPSAEAGLLERVFPGVPGWWIGLRWLCLVAGAVLTAAAARARVTFTWPTWTRPSTPVRVRTPFLWAAAVAAGTQVVAASWVAFFTRPMQLAYVGCLAVPALLAWLGSRRAHRTSSMRWGVVLACALLITAWLIVRVPVSAHAPRSADPVDTWMGWDYLERAADAQFNILTRGFLPGVTALHLVFQGVGVWGYAGIPLRFDYLQIVHHLGAVVSAAAVAAVAARLLGGAAAAVAAAVFLFSPYILMGPMQPTPYYIPSLLTASELLLLSLVQARRSVAAVAALAVLGGIGVTHPCTLPASLIAMAAAAWALWQRPRASPFVWVIGVLCFATAVFPGLPYQANLEGMQAWYGRRDWQWTMLEAGLLGQIPPEAAEITNRPGWFDLQLGAVLSPFFIPRTPIRMWGDTLFDPLGGALAACGVAVCVASWRRQPAAIGLLVLLLAGLVPAFFFSTYDRPSLARLPVLPVPMALLAAVGFEAVRQGLATRARATLAGLAVVAVAAGGVWVFDVVNPRILSASWLNLALRAVERDPDLGRVVVLEPSAAKRTFEWLRTRPIAAQVPPSPLAVVTYEDTTTLATLTAAGLVGLMFWSPAHETSTAVSRAICDQWPNAAIYTLTDDAHVSRVFAARPSGAGWHPPFPDGAWRESRCHDFRP